MYHLAVDTRLVKKVLANHNTKLKAKAIAMDLVAQATVLANYELSRNRRDRKWVA